ncbi:hypothetical protein CALVIDRAFT_551954 [Calocera viscosa TUFC12733]|uniref:Restriction of telomere capping protein 4 n=1 Tax=Calocera viscosa (strain TUFC12733) TaxID=1330018 RepID=A0A167S4F8_CALVF|nr:hypothetical protein CALVIDRAFT_551954 [Calocera viscosa TUFC12733]
MERIRQEVKMELRRPNEFRKVDFGGMGDDLRTTGSRPQPVKGRGRGPSSASKSTTSSSSQLRDSTSTRINAQVAELLEADSSEDPINLFSSPTVTPERMASASSAPRKPNLTSLSKVPAKPPPSSSASTTVKKGVRKSRAKAASKSRSQSVSDENEPVPGPSSSVSSSANSAARPFPMKLTSETHTTGKMPSKNFALKSVKQSPKRLRKATAPPVAKTKSTNKQPAAFPMDLSTSDPDSCRPDIAAPASVPRSVLSAFPMSLEQKKLPRRATTTLTEVAPNTVTAVAELSKDKSNDTAAIPPPKPFPMSLTPQKADPTEIRGKKRESPKNKARVERTERAAKKSKLEDEKVKSAVGEDESGLPTGSLESMRLNSSQSSPSNGPETEPKQICPFCDEPWPEQPSKRLTALLDQITAQAWKEPRYANPNGLSAPMEIFVTLCTLHRSESSHIPEGIAQGWPTSIDFRAIAARLQVKKHRLAKFIIDPSVSPFFQAAKNDIIEKGARVAASAFGQYETFERCQPGYYGERGMVVIQRALMSMFPDINPSHCNPLSIDDFVRQALVPEAAILLIREDLELDRANALAVLLKSRKYGMAQFPERDAGETQWQDISMTPESQRAYPLGANIVPLRTASSAPAVTGTSKVRKMMMKEPAEIEWTFDMRDDAKLSSELEEVAEVSAYDQDIQISSRSNRWRGRHDDSWLLSSSDQEYPASDGD